MFALAIVVLLFTILQFAVAGINLIYKQKIAGLKPQRNYLVSVLIPARNEANNIANILNDLINQPYQNIEIIVFDDQSEDQTPQIVAQLAEIDPRIKLVTSDRLPSGWLGKNYACHSLSILAKGDYLLFLDADVRVGKDIIGSGVAYADKHKLGLLSIFPRQLLFTIGEKSTVPIMNFILLTLLPLPMVLWSHFPSLAAANGQFMLFSAKIYKALWPHKHAKNNKVEDIAIARHFKETGIPVACLTGDESIQCRMYNGLKESVNGFSKNITAFFGNSFLLAIAFWLITSFGFIPVLIALPINISIAYLFILLIIRVFVTKVSNQPTLTNFLYIIPQQLIIGLLIFRAFTGKYLYQYQWKGRNIA